ncbi:MAG TPA: hypothetical protein VFK10_01495 [Burkholderiaceae bacterium]|nr:hypothetical protein [Burkholderiaceae bacterium]
MPRYRCDQRARRLFDAAAHHDPFSGPIDPASVSSESVYLVNLGDTLTLRGFGQRVGINQMVWDPATNTLVAQSDELLQQHSRYLLVVTDGIRDAEGQRIVPGRFNDDAALGLHEYDRDLRDGTRPGQRRDRIVAASLFTTQSISADLHKISHQLRRSTPAPVNFNIGDGGATRAVFPLANVGGILFNRQTGTAPVFTTTAMPIAALGAAGPTVGTVAYGEYNSPDHLRPGHAHRATGARDAELHPVTAGPDPVLPLRAAAALHRPPGVGGPGRRRALR